MFDHIFAFGVVTGGDHEFGGKVDRAGLERFGGVAAAPALRRVVIATGLEGRRTGTTVPFGDQIKAGLLGVGVVEAIPCGHCDYPEI